MSNNLFPVFLKVETLNGLLVGGGRVACEKLFFLLKNSPKLKIKLVSDKISPGIYEMVNEYKANITLIEKKYVKKDLDDINYILAATNNLETNKIIVQDAHEKNILVNVADMPELCDFFLSSVVTRGDLKIAVSTNGKSPTFAKRIREFLEELLPNESDELIKNLNKIRNSIKGNFSEKVRKLNELTSDLLK